MDYVCNVVGDLHIKDIDLTLTYMEIIDLSQDDFKISPRLRKSLRNSEIAAYSPGIHHNARRIKRRHQSPTVIEKIKVIEREKSIDPSKPPNFADLDNITHVCEGISGKMDRLMGKIDAMVGTLSKSSESTIHLNKHLKNIADKEIKVTYENEKLDNLIDILVEKEKKEDKIDKLLDAVQVLLKSGVGVGTVSSLNNGKNYQPSNNNFSKDDFDDSIPMYVPSLDIEEDFGKSNIKTKHVESEGTEDILAKLKKLRNN